jgi:hypothetical protein
MHSTRRLCEKARETMHVPTSSKWVEAEIRAFTLNPKPPLFQVGGGRDSGVQFKTIFPRQKETRPGMFINIHMHCHAYECIIIYIYILTLS